MSSMKPGKSGKCRSALVAAHHKLNAKEVAGSVPKQEILAMLLAARMLQMALKIKNDKIKETYLLSNSTIALSLLAGQS